MRHIAPGEVELTDDEMRLHREHEGFMDQGYGPHTAVELMLKAVPVDSTDWNLLNNERFRNYLHGHTCQASRLIFGGTMGAPGVGNTYTCPSCQIPWVQVGNVWYVADEQEDETEPPWVLSLADVI